jgi:hypothetical protein
MFTKAEQERIAAGKALTDPAQRKAAEQALVASITGMTDADNHKRLDVANAFAVDHPEKTREERVLTDQQRREIEAAARLSDEELRLTVSPTRRLMLDALGLTEARRKVHETTTAPPFDFDGEIRRLEALVKQLDAEGKYAEGGVVMARLWGVRGQAEKASRE